MPHDLDAVLDELYAAFAGPAPREVVGCPCCTDPAQLRVLVAVPLRELSAAQLEPDAGAALHTVGDAEDLRYFWPRLVELAARGESPTDVETLFAKPREANWRAAWTPRQQAATKQ